MGTQPSPDLFLPPPVAGARPSAGRGTKGSTTGGASRMSSRRSPRACAALCGCRMRLRAFVNHTDTCRIVMPHREARSAFSSSLHDDTHARDVCARIGATRGQEQTHVGYGWCTCASDSSQSFSSVTAASGRARPDCPCPLSVPAKGHADASARTPLTRSAGRASTHVAASPAIASRRLRGREATNSESLVLSTSSAAHRRLKRLQHKTDTWASHPTDARKGARTVGGTAAAGFHRTRLTMHPHPPRQMLLGWETASRQRGARAGRWPLLRSCARANPSHGQGWRRPAQLGVRDAAARLAAPQIR